jgi:hypothetical protein
MLQMIARASTCFVLNSLTEMFILIILDVLGEEVSG